MPQPGKMRPKWFAGWTVILQLSGHSVGHVDADHLYVKQLRGRFRTPCSVRMVCHILHIPLDCLIIFMASHSWHSVKILSSKTTLIMICINTLKKKELKSVWEDRDINNIQQWKKSVTTVNPHNSQGMTLLVISQIECKHGEVNPTSQSNLWIFKSTSVN